MPEIKKDFSLTTFIEVKTAIGQIINIQCCHDDKEKIKEIFDSVYKLEMPIVKEIKNVCHGGYGRYTRFDIEQKKYAGGGCGYIETIKINNSPDNRNGNIVHECSSSTSTFWEFDTIENAMAAWELSWGNSHPEDKLKVLKGFVREVKCGWYSPWFYAVANQALQGDFAFPNSVGKDHPIYRPFNNFKIAKDVYNFDSEEYDKEYEVKTCIGYTEEMVRYDYDKSYKNYTIYWDDGTCWSGSSLKEAPELLKKEDYKIVLKPKICDYVKKRKYNV